MYVIFDLHDTIAQFIESWLKSYNYKWKDNLKKEQITDWDLKKFVKQECGSQVYDLLKYPKIYKRMNSVPYAFETVNAFRNLGFEIVYGTACENSVIDANFEWLKEYGFWKNNDHLIVTTSKNLIRGDILFDDGWHNVENFPGFKVLIGQPWNQNINFKNRINSFKEILDDIDKYKDAI